MLSLIPSPTLFPYTTLFRSRFSVLRAGCGLASVVARWKNKNARRCRGAIGTRGCSACCRARWNGGVRSEEHTSELQSLVHLVCRLLLEKKKANIVAYCEHRI